MMLFFFEGWPKPKGPARKGQNEKAGPFEPAFSLKARVCHMPGKVGTDQGKT
jgi:hypothetical protein